jgi:23S rRNA (pseudouridine1915-N3)-methyltransferase
MRIRVLCVGKQSTKHLEPAIRQYLQRLESIASVGIETVASSNIEDESTQLLRRLNKQELVVLFDERGKQLTTPALAQHIENWQNSGTKSVTMIIGGAYGVSQAVTDRADIVWALSRLVFPHELVRLIAIEQLYRAYDILRGGKYHHD